MQYVKAAAGPMLRKGVALQQTHCTSILHRPTTAGEQKGTEPSLSVEYLLLPFAGAFTEGFMTSSDGRGIPGTR